MIEPNCESVPDIAWQYWGIHETMEKHPFMYGLDNLRTTSHVQLCDHYKLTREQTLKVTDHLNTCENAVQMHEKLMELTGNPITQQ